MSSATTTTAAPPPTGQPAGQPAVSAAARLAPALPAPPADLRLLTAALLLLAVALSLVWLAAARLRRRQRPRDERRQAILKELDRTKFLVTCPCRPQEAARASRPVGPWPMRPGSPCGPPHQVIVGREATPRPGSGNGCLLGSRPGDTPDRLGPSAAGGAAADLTAAGQRPCADRVQALLTEFASAVTGLPCSRMTTEEMRTCTDRLPSAVREAFARLLDTLAVVDLDRFTPRPPQPAGLCLVDVAVATVRNWPEGPATGPSPAGSKGLS